MSKGAGFQRWNKRWGGGAEWGRGERGISWFVRKKTAKELGLYNKNGDCEGANVARRQIEKMLGLYSKKGDCEEARSWCCEKID